MTLFAGIDAGSRAVKAVLWDSARQRIAGSAIADQGVRQSEVARDLFRRLLEESGVEIEQAPRCAATGYGRNLVDFADAVVTEITCHALGVRRLFPSARTVVDIGGQDSKTIRLDAEGAVQDFSMNDRCAAGTGRFLEIVAQRLGVGIAELGPLAARSRSPAAVSGMCVVFAESEIVGLLASGTPAEDIVAGVEESIARRVAGMAGRRIDDPVVFAGGVALVPGMKEALERALERRVEISPQPQFTGALGAALFAAK